MKEQKHRKINKDSIDILLLFKTIWIERVFVLKITSIFMIIGFFIAVFTKNVFTASTTFVPVGQSGTSLKGNLGGLASLAGISLGSSSSGSMEISPELYPQILDNISFKKELMGTKLSIEGIDSMITYEDYYKKVHNTGLLVKLKKYTLGLPNTFRNSFGEEQIIATTIGDSESLIKISADEYELMNHLKEQIKLSVNEKEGYISLEVDFPEALAASELTLEVRRLLQHYILNLKTQKSKEELDFLVDRFTEKEHEMNDLKIRLAKYQDQNTSINTSLGRSQLLDLQSQYNLSFDVYSELAKNVETQRFQLKKDTPIFTVLSPVAIPFEKSGPKRLLILLVYAFLGIVFSIGLVLFKSKWYELKNQWNTK